MNLIFEVGLFFYEREAESISLPHALFLLLEQGSPTKILRLRHTYTYISLICKQLKI